MADPVYIEVPSGVRNQRADRFLSGEFEDLSRTRIQLSFSSGHVTVNGELVQKRFLVNEGDMIEIYLPEPQETRVLPVEMPLNVLHEDEDIVVVNKAPGMVTHPGAGTGSDTLVHGVLAHCHEDLSSLGGSERPGVVHRLDKDTSGAIIFAKTDKAYLKLVQMFSNRDLKKRYIALVHGQPVLESGHIDEPIGRNPGNRTKMQINRSGREAQTSWVRRQLLGERYAILECDLHTGRTHQIRVHLAHLGHSIVGDIVYGRGERQERSLAPRQLLHAAYLSFKHPINGAVLELEAPLPDDFQHCIDDLG